MGSHPRARHNTGIPNRSSKKGLLDVNQLGKLILDLATGQDKEPESEEPNPDYS